MRPASATLLLAGGVALSACPPTPPPPTTCVCPTQTGPVPVPVKVVNMVPETLSGESAQDSEPFLAVDPSDAAALVGTAFTPNPFGTGSGLAPVYVSTDGGDSWSLNLIVPSAGPFGTGDITVAGGGAAVRLHGGILRIPGNLLLNVLRTDDFTAAAPMAVLRSRNQVDQPFIQVRAGSGDDRVYVGSNDFAAGGGRTATVDLSLDAGGTFESVRIEPRATSGQDGPSIRPAVARDGTAYAAYFGWRSFNGQIATSDVVVVRDDDGGGPNAFQDLVDPDDSLPGRKVVEGVSIPWSNGSALGLERIGSSLSLAVHPSSSGTVYVAWADRIGNGDIYSIHVRRSTDRGVTWTNDLKVVRDATCFGLAVSDDGTLGFLYQQLAGPSNCQCWVTHLEQTKDGFATVQDTVLASVPADRPPRQFLPYIGDYNFVLSVAGEFRGIFSANNEPDRAHFPNGVRYQRSADFDNRTLSDGAGSSVAISIDPFYFSVGVVP